MISMQIVGKFYSWRLRLQLLPLLLSLSKYERKYGSGFNDPEIAVIKTQRERERDGERQQFESNRFWSHASENIRHRIAFVDGCINCMAIMSCQFRIHTRNTSAWRHTMYMHIELQIRQSGRTLDLALSLSLRVSLSPSILFVYGK